MTITAQAVPIIGDITFGSVGSVSLTGGTGTFSNATGLQFTAAPAGPYVGYDASVGFAPAVTGHFVSAQGQGADFADFTFAPLPGGGVNPIWTVAIPDGFSFHLTSVNVARTSTSITLSGLGIVYSTNPNLQQNSGDYNFTVQGDTAASAFFSFSADANSPSRVPDGGSVLILLGSAFVGLLGIARKSIRTV